MRKNMMRIGLLALMLFISQLILPESYFVEQAEAEEGWIDIATRADLDTLPSPATGNYRLVNDIDMGDAPWMRGITLEGRFDGQGYAIRNLYTEERRRMSGLFTTISDGGLVENLVLDVTIVNAKDFAGGLASWVQEGGTIANVYVIGTITNAGNTTGGIVGINEGTIRSSASDVHIGSANEAGGIAGNNSASGEIANSYAIGDVQGEVSAGGLIGNNTGTITNSYAAGQVSGTGYVGGLIGFGTGTVTNSYWDMDTTQQSSSAGGTGLTTEQMQQITSFAHWDFFTEWSIDEGEGYPDLQAFAHFPALATEVHTISDLLDMHQSDEAYQLMNDLDFAGYTGTWTPINFEGYFDGNGYKIQNFKVSENRSSMGLFGMNQGTIQHLIMENVEVQGIGFNTGSLVASNRGTIDHVSVVSGTVEGESDVGGLAGTNSGTIRHSNASVTVISHMSEAGGLVGSVKVIDSGGTLYTGEVIDSYATGEVSGIYDVGGLVGVNDGMIRASYATGSVINGQQERFGGLIGHNDSNGSVQESFALGNVTGRYDAGGLIGLNEGSVRYAYAIGDVYANGSAIDSPREYAGGLIGRNLETGTIEQAYAVGEVSGHSGRPEIVGGLLGGNANSDANAILEAYWNTDTSRQQSSASGTGLTTAELASCTIYEDWDLTKWDCADGHYPKLHQITADDSYDVVALLPEAEPAGGLYNDDVTVELRGEAGAKIYYTLDESEPTTASTEYGDPILIEESSTLKAIQVDSASNHSQVLESTYEIDRVPPEKPTPSVAGGLYNGDQTIMLDSDVDSTIYYTLDGQEPDTGSELYTGAFTIEETTTLKAIAVDQAGNLSEVMVAEYVMDRTAPVVEQLEPAAGSMDVSLHPKMKLVFSEPVFTGSGSIALKVIAEDYTVETIDVTGVQISGSGTDTIEVELQTTLLADTAYGVVVDSTAFRDEAGNYYAGMDDARTWQFETLYIPSGNAKLSDLRVDSGTLMPDFSPDEYAYAVRLDHSVERVTVSADVYDELATMSMDGTMTSSLQFELATGQSYTIPIQVIAEDGTITSYTIEASRDASPDASLQSLAVDVGALTPVFDPNVRSYSLDLNEDQSEVTVTAAVYHEAATVRIDGELASSRTLAVPMGTTSVRIDVTAQNGAEQTYELVIRRLDRTIPQIVQLEPAAGSANVSLNPKLKVVFSKPMYVDNGYITLKTITDDSAVETIDVTGSQISGNGTDTFEVDLQSTLLADTAYGVEVDSTAFQDEAGNYYVGMDDASTWQFETVYISRSSGGGSSSGNSQDTDVMQIRNVDVHDGNGSLLLTIDVIRQVTEDGVTQDVVTLDPEQTLQVIEQATEMGLTLLTLQIPDDEQDPADEIVFNLPSDSLHALSRENIPLGIGTAHAALQLSRQAMADVQEQGMRFVFAQEDEERNQVEGDQLLRETLGEDTQRLSSFFRIEGPHAKQTKVMLPLNNLEIPEEPLAREAYLAGLQVFIHHSNGEIVTDRGLWEWGSSELPHKISIYVDHFSTFVITHDPHALPSDIQGHWAESAILGAINRQLVIGYEDGSFQPNRQVSRAEFTAMLVRVMGVWPEKSDPVFDDLAGHWAAAAIMTAYEWGWVTGVQEQQFRPNDPITREQMAVMLVQAANLQAVGDRERFKDEDAISPWAVDAIHTLTGHDILRGYPKGIIAPKRPVSRAEAVTVLRAMMSKEVE